MFSHIKTSKQNKQVVTKLTNKLGLGAENVVARIAIAYSLSNHGKLDLANLRDSGGKEYSSKVLFGEQVDVYIGMVRNLHGLYYSDIDIPKYIKLHLDSGLEALDAEYEAQKMDGFDFVVARIR